MRSPTNLFLQASSVWEIEALDSQISIELYDLDGLNPTPFVVVPSGESVKFSLPGSSGQAPLYGSRKIKLVGDSEFKIWKDSQGKNICDVSSLSEMKNTGFYSLNSDIYIVAEFGSDPIKLT